jgi:hypothetical protein
MSCSAITDFLTRETGRYVTPIMQRRTFPRSIWMSIARRGAWMPGMGTTLNVLQYERSAPTDAEPTWNDVTVTDGAEGGSCLPATTRINVASTNRSFSLKRIAFEGPDICNIDTMHSFDLQNQLVSTLGIIGDYVRISWEIRYRHEYFRLVQTKVVLDDCDNPTRTDTAQTSYSAVCADLPLHIRILRRLSIDFMRDGAGAESLLRGTGGNPLLTVITDSESAGNIARQNLNIREDIRFSNQANLLVRAFGISYAYGDFTFLIDTTPRRFSCSAGTRTEIAPYALTAASKGQKAIINSSWKTAAETETFVFDPAVVSFLIPTPPTSPAPNVQFNPVSYTGDVKLLNILDRVCNPLGTVVYHRADLMAASMPGDIERGAAIVHLRCEPEGCQTSCLS